MTKLTLDHATVSRLGNLDESIEFCDESGRTLGFFTPVPDASLYEAAQSPPSDAELRRRDEEESGRSLQEILAALQERR